jgi:uncharacterized protein DUF3471
VALTCRHGYSTVRRQWYSLGDIPEPPESGAPASAPSEEIVGTYESRLYGTLVITSGAEDGDGGFTLSLGRVTYPGILRHWDGDTYQAVWNDPDDLPDLFVFTVEGRGRVSGFQGEGMGEFKKVYTG